MARHNGLELVLTACTKNPEQEIESCTIALLA